MIDRHWDGIAAYEAHGQLPWRELRLVEGQGDDPRADVIGDTVPHPWCMEPCRPPEVRKSKHG